MFLQNNGGHDYLSNQSLGGLPAGVGNLEGPGGVDFGTYEGEQFFEVELAPREILIKGIEFRNGFLVLETFGLNPGTSYHIEMSDDLGSVQPWAPLLGGGFTSTAENQEVFISVTSPNNFHRIVEGPEPMN
jgi:hypothetical protein